MIHFQIRASQLFWLIFRIDGAESYHIIGNINALERGTFSVINDCSDIAVVVYVILLQYKHYIFFLIERIH